MTDMATVMECKASAKFCLYRSVIANLLEPIGFEIIEAVNPQEGLEKAYSVKPDVIITDLAIPYNL
ncbi:integral membrane sensor hybrid histidine kinase [Calothrix parasitica NIES-267]|uniref:Integral membrane sensor hybrid histidine kinase n=1 Tax=Calothrix parasitica NIES-267 TaxID=1973488 RepID=A0A1Z4LN16_9CYAN|nr:integral membrane sensor hybrid histidine kinase [Calothrix parasitica NIES-267]